MPDDDKQKSNGPKWAVMGGIALNVEYTRKYGFEATAAARVTAKLIALPPPKAFQDAVLADAIGRKKPNLVPPPVVPPPQNPPPAPPPAGGSPPPNPGIEGTPKSPPLTLRFE